MNKEHKYSGTVDLYALGVMMYNFYTKKYPFDPTSRNIFDLEKLVTDGQFAMPENISDEGKDLLTKLICPQNKRVNFD